MPRVRRSADVTWEGNVARGVGRISAATGAFSDLPYSQPTRVGKPDGKTSPEELLAAAHAGCYAMSLSNVLSQGGNEPQSLDVKAKVTLDRAGDGFAITRSDLTARGTVEGVDDAAFAEAARQAEVSCPVSNLIRGSAEITVDASLDGA